MLVQHTAPVRQNHTAVYPATAPLLCHLKAMWFSSFFKLFFTVVKYNCLQCGFQIVLKATAYSGVPSLRATLLLSIEGVR